MPNFNYFKNYCKIQKDNFLYSKTRKVNLKNIISIGIAILIALFFSIIIGITTDPIKPSFIQIFVDIFATWTTSNFAISRTLFQMTVFGLAGLSFLIAFRSGLFNINISGQMTFSAIISFIIIQQILDANVQVPHGLGQVILILLSMVFGGLIAYIVAIIKTFFKVHEVVTSIILNWVLVYLGNYLLQNYGGEASASQTSTLDLNSNFALYDNTWSPSTWWVPGFIILIIVIFLTFILFRYTVMGHKFTSIKSSLDGSVYAGYKIRLQQCNSFLLSGMVAGLLGAVFYFGNNLSQSLPTQAIMPEIQGFNGIAISLIALNSPIAVLGSSFIIAMFTVSTSQMITLSQATNIAPLIIGIIMYFVAIYNVFLYFKPWQKIIQIFYSKAFHANYEAYQSKRELLASKAKLDLKELYYLMMWTSDRRKGAINSTEYKIATTKIIDQYKLNVKALEKDFYLDMAQKFQNKIKENNFNFVSLRKLSIYWIFKMKIFYYHSLLKQHKNNELKIKQKIQFLGANLKLLQDLNFTKNKVDAYTNLIEKKEEEFSIENIKRSQKLELCEKSAYSFLSKQYQFLAKHFYHKGVKI